MRMRRSIREVLSSRKGMADALGMTMVAMAMLVAVGLVVGNYAILSKRASQLQSLSQEIANRAELYAGALNADLSSPQVPTMARQCSSTPSMCTTIVSATPSADGSQTVLRIQGDSVSAVGESVTKDVTLVSKTVTHVTGVSQTGGNIWALTGEGLQYRIWGVASGDPTTVDPAAITVPKAGAGWVSVATRAGIDSAGSLWVWGKDDIGQAGIGSVSASPVGPQAISGTASFRAVVTTDDRGYAIDSAGDTWVWGKNDKGQLGLGNTNPVMVPTRIPGARMMSFAVGLDNVFMLGMDGSLSVVGASQAGFPANSGTAAQVLNPGTVYTAVAASTTGAVAMIDSSGSLSMKGNAYPYTPGTVKFGSVSLGGTAGYAISTAGDLYSWGTGSNGQLGLGSTTSAATPTQVMPGTKFVAVKGASTAAFAIDTTGRLYYFGKTAGGSLGGTYLPQANVPTPLLAESRFRDVAANGGDTAVSLLDTAGNLYGMGTAQPGLWPINYLGANDQPIRMPALASTPTPAPTPTPTPTDPIDIKYNAVNGPALLGNPTGAETASANGGMYRCYDKGCIEYLSATGAFTSLNGPIRSEYQSAGGDSGKLGYPTSDDQQASSVSGGQYQSYQNGAIHWSSATGAHYTYGAIRQRWVATGSESGMHGFPTSDEISGLAGGGVKEQFQNGWIYWSPSTPSASIAGAIGSFWLKAGAETSKYGYPLGSEIGSLKNGGSKQQFQNGYWIYWSPTTLASIGGAIGSYWLNAGAENSKWGYPTGEEYSWNGGVRQDYQGGYITWSSSGGTQGY